MRRLGAVLCALLFALCSPAAGAEPAAIEDRRLLLDQASLRSPGQPRRQVGRVHHRHLQPGRGQEREPGLDGARRRRRRDRDDPEGRLVLEPALEPRRQVARVPLRAQRRRNPGLAAQPPGRRGRAAHRHQAGRRGIHLVARRLEARPAHPGPHAGAARAIPRGSGSRPRPRVRSSWTVSSSSATTPGTSTAAATTSMSFDVATKKAVAGHLGRLGR